MSKNSMVKILTFPLLAILASCASVEGGNPAVTWQDRPTSAESIYQGRFKRLAGREQIDYDTMGVIPGASAENVALMVQSQTDISEDALNAAKAYGLSSPDSAVLIWHKGALVAEAYSGEGTAETTLNSKSLAKALTAVAIGRAIELGFIAGLDQKVADFIVEWQGTPKAAMTMRQMLSMHSGLLEQNFDFSEDSPIPRAYLDPYHGQYIVDEYPLTDTPGARYAYSNATSDLVAVVIERATQRQYEEFVGTEIFTPIGAPGGLAWLNREGGLAHSGCCMQLPARSWLKLGVLLLNDGVVAGDHLLPNGFVKEMKTASPGNSHYGLGLWLGSPYMERRGFLGSQSPIPGVLHSAPYLADDVTLFDGSGNQVAYIVPSKELVVLRMGARPSGDPKEVPEWDNSKMLNLVLSGMKN